MGSTANDLINMDVKDESLDRQNDEEVEDLEWSADQEILLLYSVHGYKPVGPNKHFRMLLIQDRLSNAMNKNISAKAIWKKLNTLYDLEALDEAEAEADAAVAVETEFALPEEEFGELMAERIRGSIKIEKFDSENDSFSIQRLDVYTEIKPEPDSTFQDSESENNRESLDTSKGTGAGKDVKKESAKRGSKKKDLTPVKDNTPSKKDNTKETPKKDLLNKKDTAKEPKKGIVKEDEKKEVGKKSVQDLKKDNIKEEKKELGIKFNKRESAEKKIVEQSKKDVDVKKADQKKLFDTQKSQRVETVKPRAETPKQLRTETPKRTEAKTVRSETPKPQRTETPKPQRVEVLKKESSTEKKKEAADKKVERKSPEKTPESIRITKLRTREKKDTESEKSETPTGTKRERSRDSTSKATDGQMEEPPAKKAKTPVIKGRPTRNSIEPQKPTSPTTSPQKRRTRLL